jgi:hypothetical protein
VTVTSVGIPSISGTYLIDEDSQRRIAAVAQYISTNNRFPDGLSQLPYKDADGQPHLFPTTASWLAFATGIADYVTAQAIGESPAQPVEIP